MASANKWEDAMGDYRVDTSLEEHNASLGPVDSAREFERACHEFLGATVGLKLKPGPMNSLGRMAWTRVLMALDGISDYETETSLADRFGGKVRG